MPSTSTSAPAPNSFPGFNGIRFLGALSVLFSHSFLIAGGPACMDPIAKWLGHQNTPGEYAVSNFFILSGFLLMRSVRKDPTPLRFLANRLLRLVPAFWASLAVTLFLIAPCLSTVGLWEWFSSPALWKSFFDSAMCLGDYTNLPIHASRFPELEGFINGALWTLPYEFACYLFLLFLSVTLKTPARIAAGAFLFGLVALLGPILLPVTAELHQAGSANQFQLPLFMHDRTLPFFCAGILLDFLDLKFRVTKRHAFPALALFLLSFFFHLEYPAYLLLGPIFLLWIGRNPGPLRRLPIPLGEISYGVYLFGWPVTLVGASFLPSLSPVQVLLCCLPVLLGLGLFIRGCVEQPIQNRLRPLVLRELPKTLPAAPAHWAFRLLVAVCLGRFLIYPWPGSDNWFGFQPVKLAVLILLLAWIDRKLSRLQAHLEKA